MLAMGDHVHESTALSDAPQADSQKGARATLAAQVNNKGVTAVVAKVTEFKDGE